MGCLQRHQARHEVRDCVRGHGAVTNAATRVPSGLHRVREDYLVSLDGRRLRFQSFRMRSGVLRPVDVEFRNGQVMPHIHPYATGPVLDDSLDDIAKMDDVFTKLTFRESLLFECVLEGRTLAQIAASEHISIADLHVILLGMGGMITRNFWVWVWAETSARLKGQAEAASAR